MLAALDEGHEFVHFCCHGSFNVLAPENSALHLSSERDHDARNITAADLRKARLKGTSLVTLSACSSGAASTNATNDLFGLTGSLLRSGARAVIGSRWPVSDAFALRFMCRLYQRIGEGAPDAASAFSATAAELSQAERLENWASFAYVGI